MNVVTDWGQALLTAISQAFSKLFSFLPDLIGALLILWIGWIIAGILSKVVAGVLRKIRFNEAADKAGMGRFLGSAGVKQDPSGVMGEIVKWFFRIIALVAAFSVLQLPALTAALTGILNFIPNLAIALVIILIGGLIANFVAEFVKGATGSAGFKNSGMLSNIARYAILFVAVIAALGQIGVAETVINTLFIGTIAALALAFGLAFGLGGRDTAAKMLESAYSSAQENLPKLGEGMKKQSAQTGRQMDQAMRPQGQLQPQPQFQPQPYQSGQGQTNYSGNYPTGAQQPPNYPTAPTQPYQPGQQNPNSPRNTQG